MYIDKDKREWTEFKIWLLLTSSLGFSLVTGAESAGVVSVDIILA